MSELVHGCGQAQGLAPRKGLLYAKPILHPIPISMFWPELLGATCLLACPAAHCLACGGSEQPLFCAHLILSFPHQIICNRHQAIGPIADSISALCCHSRFSAPG